ncbi:MAG TPA: Pycsar system effector family protein [Pilimelia sp.]|nr:Pycsar system effector family protein [Pilimelia sp.]
MSSQTQRRGRRAGHRHRGTSAVPDLQAGLVTVGSFQSSIQHADSKITALLAAQGGLMALAAGQAAAVRSLPPIVGLAPVVLMGGLSLLTVLGSCVSMWHLAAAMRPRLGGPTGSNRFGFPNVAAHGVRAFADDRRQGEELWELAAVLARIALAKHQRIRRALPWIGASFVACVGWFLLMATAAVGAAAG